VSEGSLECAAVIRKFLAVLWWNHILASR